MHGRVKRAPRIELPNERDDELPLRSLIATSVACALAGLTVAYAITGRGGAEGAIDGKPAAMAPEPLPEHAPEPPAEPSSASPPIAAAALDAAVAIPEVAIAAPEVAIAAPDAAIAQAAPAPEAEPAPATAAIAADPAAATEGRGLRVQPGFFAYLRCDGLRRRKGRYPCPRDRALELGMREIVEQLPTCREAHAISRGMFDVRLELGPGGTVTDLHVKAPDEGAERAVRACAAAAFRKVQTALRPTRMIVSMRFKAR